MVLPKFPGLQIMFSRHKRTCLFGTDPSNGIIILMFFQWNDIKNYHPHLHCDSYFNICQDNWNMILFLHIVQPDSKLPVWPLSKHFLTLYTNKLVITQNSLCTVQCICFSVRHRNLKTRSTSPSLWLCQQCGVPSMWGTWRFTTARRWRSTFCRMSWRASNRGWACWWITTGYHQLYFVMDMHYIDIMVSWYDSSPGLQLDYWIF